MKIFLHSIFFAFFLISINISNASEAMQEPENEVYVDLAIKQKIAEIKELKNNSDKALNKSKFKNDLLTLISSMKKLDFHEENKSNYNSLLAISTEAANNNHLSQEDILKLTNMIINILENIWSFEYRHSPIQDIFEFER